MKLSDKIRFAMRSRWDSWLFQIRKSISSSGWIRKSLADRYRCQEISFLEKKSDEYVSLIINDKISPSIRAIAFYLPQFHPIEENDKWWGTGFTEWTNVVRGRPQFSGHYQPHLPGDLGFYDLRLVDIQKKQIELAKNYGIEGFCFYFYWFRGKRLLELPVKNWLQPTLDLPFCLCWANENWSRRWDGLDSDVLISQDYSEEDDLDFIEYVSQYLMNEKYIKVDNKPIIIIYRPGLLPDAKRTMSIWRKYCWENGIGDIYIGYIESKDFGNPSKFGCDVSIEFPPNGCHVPVVSHDIEYFNRYFKGIVKDYNDVVHSFTSRKWPSYESIRGVCPSWDNEARRRGKGTTLINSTPAAYKAWMKRAIRQIKENVPAESKRLLFINAWNEWAEGAHLEPDQYYGYAWLQATYEALREEAGRGDDKNG